MLVGPDHSRKVADVELELEAKRVTIHLRFTGKRVTCPCCEASCTKADHAPERTCHEGKPADLGSLLNTHRIDVVLSDEAVSPGIAGKVLNHLLGVSGITFCAITAQRRFTHPAIIAVTQRLKAAKKKARA